MVVACFLTGQKPCCPPQTMLTNILKFLFGIALIPLCIGYSWELLVLFPSLSFRDFAPYHFIAGALAYTAAHLLFRRPILAYVFGHELTHAFFTALFGGSVTSFHASERGGRVTITKSNFIITLAPYFFPLYTALVLLLYGLAILSDAESATPWLVFLSGATFAFHVVLTFIFLQADQDDIREHGAVFSYPLIYLFNVLFISVIVRILLADNMDYTGYLENGIIRAVRMVGSGIARIIPLFGPW